MRSLQADSSVDADIWGEALEWLDTPVYLVDLQDRLLRANQAFYQKIKLTADEAVGMPVTRYFHPEGEEQPCPVCKARYDRKDAVIIVDAEDPSNHSGVDMRISVRVIRDEHGQPMATLQHIQDLSDIKQAQRLARRNEEKFRILLDAAPDPLIIVNKNGTIEFANQLSVEVFGYTQEQLHGSEIEMFLPEEKHAIHKILRKDYAKTPRLRPMGSGIELQAVKASGELMDVEVSLSPICIDDEFLVIASIRDISERKKIERERGRLSNFPKHNPMPIFEVARDGQVIFMNNAAGRLLEDNLDVDVSSLIAGLDSVFKELDRKGGSIIRDISCGNHVFEQKIVYLEEFDVILVYSWDITQIRLLVNKLSYHATHDSLTGLVNRSEFERRIDSALQQAQFDYMTHVLCYLDLDQFKLINDSCGHLAGDNLLKQVAELLRGRIRGGDTLARLGGDEFGLLLISCDLSNALKVTEQVRKEIESFRFVWGKKVFSIGVSVGIVAIDENSRTPNELLQAADTACYIAKDRGRNRIHVFEEENSGLRKHIQTIEWAQKIQQAISNNEFVIYKQKIQHISRHDDYHYEILVRMNDSNRIILPSAFLPSAERYHLERKIDEWVIDNTFASIVAGKLNDRKCAINLSNSSLTDNAMINYIVEKISEYEIDTEKVCFEITESAMISGLFQVQRMVSTLKGLGCQFYLDDFGSGVSSFCYLRNIPVDAVKIDGLLVKDSVTHASNEAMVRAINDITHVMGVETIAEYVADHDILVKMAEIGIDYVQGYEIHKPEPVL